MSIYNRKTLIVILLLTIIISILFFMATKKDNYDKDDLYENKIADHDQQFYSHINHLYHSYLFWLP